VASRKRPFPGTICEHRAVAIRCHRLGAQDPRCNHGVEALWLSVHIGEQVQAVNARELADHDELLGMCRDERIQRLQLRQREYTAAYEVYREDVDVSG
jgi:hypothetical protein